MGCESAWDCLLLCQNEKLKELTISPNYAIIDILSDPYGGDAR